MHKIIRRSLGIVAATLMLALTGCGNIVVHDLTGEELISTENSNDTLNSDNQHEDNKTVADDNTVVNDNNFYFEGCLDQEDNLVTPSELFGNRDVTMVNVWATFCGPCIGEMPDLDKLALELDKENIGLVGICCDVMDYEGGIDEGQLSLAKDIIAETGVHYTNVMLNDMDYLDSVVNTDAVPTTFFVDTDGTVIGSVQVGAVDMETYMKLAHEALDIVRGESEE